MFLPAMFVVDLLSVPAYFLVGGLILRGILKWDNASLPLSREEKEGPIRYYEVIRPRY
jgi:hypothetical protein